MPVVADSVAMADQYGHKEALCGALHGAVEPGGAVEPAAALMKATADLTTALWGPQFARGCFYNTSCLRHGPWEADPTQDMSRQVRCHCVRRVVSAGVCSLPMPRPEKNMESQGRQREITREWGKGWYQYVSLT